MEARRLAKEDPDVLLTSEGTFHHEPRIIDVRLKPQQLALTEPNMASRMMRRLGSWRKRNLERMLSEFLTTTKLSRSHQNPRKVYQACQVREVEHWSLLLCRNRPSINGLLLPNLHNNGHEKHVEVTAEDTQDRHLSRCGSDGCLLLIPFIECKK